MTTVRGSIPNSVVPGIHAFVGMSYGKTPEEHLPLYEVVKTNRAFEEEVMLSGMGSARAKAEGASVEYDDIQETWKARYVMETLALAFAVSKEAFDDDLYSNIVKAKSEALGKAMADAKQVKAAATFNRGFNASFVGGDGVSLFSNTHPTTSGSDFDNRFAQDLTESALEDVCIAISEFKDDRGILISAKPKSLHIPAQLYFTASKILRADYSQAAVRNVAGSENVGGILMQPNVVGGHFNGGLNVNHRFTDPDAWFVKTDVANGTKMFVREALTGKEDVSFDTDNLLFKVRERYAFGWTDPRQWLGSEGS